MNQLQAHLYQKVDLSNLMFVIIYRFSLRTMAPALSKLANLRDRSVSAGNNLRVNKKMIKISIDKIQLCAQDID